MASNLKSKRSWNIKSKSRIGCKAFYKSFAWKFICNNVCMAFCSGITRVSPNYVKAAYSGVTHTSINLMKLRNKESIVVVYTWPSISFSRTVSPDVTMNILSCGFPSSTRTSPLRYLFFSICFESCWLWESDQNIVTSISWAEHSLRRIDFFKSSFAWFSSNGVNGADFPYSSQYEIRVWKLLKSFCTYLVLFC